MKAVIVESNGQVSLRDVPIPEINDYQALLKVQATAICGTDLKILHNRLKGYSNYPTVLGHEAVGEVVSIGSKVHSFKVGDYVIHPGIYDRCGKYYTTWGAMAEYAVVNDAAALIEGGFEINSPIFPDHAFSQKVIPREIHPVPATMIITFREVLSAIKRMRFQSGESIVIYGAGPVGLSFIRLCKIIGMSPIICVIRGSGKKQQALDAGADVVLVSSDTDVDSEIRKMFPLGVDVLLDAAGDPSLITKNLNLVRMFGKVCIYGVTPENKVMVDWSNAPYSFELLFSQWPDKREEAAVHDEIIEMMLDGRLNGMDFISDVYDFSDAVSGINFFLERKNMKKVVFELE